MEIFNKNEVRFLPVVRPVFGFPRARGMMCFLNFHRHSLHPTDPKHRAGKVHRPSTQVGGRCFLTQRSRSQRNELGPQGIDCGLDDLRYTRDRQHFVEELVESRHRRADQTAQHLALAV